MNNKAIAIKVLPTLNNADTYDKSRFFGDPAVPDELVNELVAQEDGQYYEDMMFFCQINLQDIAQYNTGNLPKSGMLYVFLDTEMMPYTPHVYISQHEPTTVLIDYNHNVSEYEHLTTPYLMQFDLVDEHYQGTKLFGTMSDWAYAPPAPQILMQYDPLDSDMDFLQYIDGYVYLVCEDDDPTQLSMMIEHY